MHKKISNIFRNNLKLGMRLTVFMVLMAMVFSSVLPVAAAPRVGTVSVAGQTGTLNAGTGGSVTYSVTVTKGNNQTLTANLSITGTLPAGVTATFVPSSLNFGAAATGTQLTSLLTLNTTAATPGGAATFTVRAVRNTNAGDFTTNTGTLNITAVQVAPTLTFGAAPTPTFLGGNFTVSATTNSNGALTYSVVSGPCALVGGATFSSSGAGICLVKADTAATASFFAASAQQPVTIAPATPTFNFAADPYPFFPGGDFAVVATTNSDGARTFSYISGPCTLVDANLGTFTPTGVGACLVQVNTAATTNFTAGSAQQSEIGRAHV